MTVYRQDPAINREPIPHVHEIPLEEKSTVLYLLRVIFEKFDPALAYRGCNCYRGVCGACLVNVNGRNLRACNVLVRPGDTVTIRPARGFPLVRDLVVDLGSYPDTGGESNGV